MTAPLPPPDINARSLRFTTITITTTLYRFYRRGRDHPIHFDRSRTGRLNSPDGSFGVLYAAQHRRGAFAETFLREPGRDLLAEDLIESRALVSSRSTRALRVVNLHGPGLAVLGATAEITSSPLPYDTSQAWAAALHDHPGAFDGIAYRARHDNDEICYALFNRSAPMTEVDRDEMLLDANWFTSLLKHYSIGVISARKGHLIPPTPRRRRRSGAIAPLCPCPPEPCPCVVRCGGLPNYPAGPETRRRASID
jgi:RES domain